MMKLYVIDAFSPERFGGNAAGVVLLGASEPFPPEDLMRRLAAELKHSETAFVHSNSQNAFHIRYFTPTGEIDLCGHATIASFHALLESGRITHGAYLLRTQTGELSIDVDADGVWMDMARPEYHHTFCESECDSLYHAFGLTKAQRPDSLMPAIVSTGLKDIMLPVCSLDALQTARMNKDTVSALSAENDVTGFHLFTLGAESRTLAHCRNFAPLCGIDEESATGTSNGALTYYCFQNGLIGDGRYRIVQGEAMGRPSEIRTQLKTDGTDAKIRVGGVAATVFCTDFS